MSVCNNSNFFFFPLQGTPGSSYSTYSGNQVNIQIKHPIQKLHIKPFQKEQRNINQ